MKQSPGTTHPVRDFFLRGLTFGGFGPVILGVVYLVLHFSLEDLTISGVEVFTAIISTYLLAFVHAGASVFNQIESWPVAKSTLCHFGLLYIAYVLCYLINSWIPFEPAVLGIFTAIFAAGYATVWMIVYISIRVTVKRLNRSLR
jgi:hypothetical protein